MKSTIDPQEVAKFREHREDWWNLDGPLKTLHDINESRLLFIEECMPLPGANVLDVGCGGGILSEAMARLGAHVTGLDVEVQAIKSAKAHATANQVSVDYQCTNIETFEHEPYDLVTCMEMLEHVKVPEEIIKHCARLLKPNGLLVMSTINRTFQAYVSVVLVAEYVLNLLPRQTHDYQKFITPSELSQMARREGLEILKLKGMSYNPLTRQATLQTSVAANYLMACRK